MNPDSLPLRDIHLPAPLGWWPLAPGWWIVGALVFVLLIAGLIWLWKRQNRQPQGATLALDQLAQLQRQYAQQPAALLRELSVLLRRVAINQYGRERVSGLTGNAWVEFLDQQAGKPLFAPRFTTLLTEHPYRPDAPVETAALIQAIRTWINLQQGKRHV